jgi:hypothetical protein
MPEINLAIFELVALLIVIPLSYVLGFFVKRFTANTYEDEILKLFSFYWNGEPEDEIYAWMKVRYVLEKREEAKKKIQYVNQKINNLNKQPLYGSLKVNSKGELLSDEHLKE